MGTRIKLDGFLKAKSWTAELAYAVGLLVTDGNLSKDGQHITMRSSDMDLLETFCRCLGLKNKITQSYNNGWARRPSYRVQFAQKKDSGRIFINIKPAFMPAYQENM